MNNSRRYFLKVIALSAVVVPTIGSTSLIGLSKSTKRVVLSKAPQANVGGGLSGVDLSQFYRNPAKD
ncbi:hypothetical protein [Thalassotalea fusca]